MGHNRSDEKGITPDAQKDASPYYQHTTSVLGRLAFSIKGTIGVPDATKEEIEKASDICYDFWTDNELLAGLCSESCLSIAS